MTDVIKNFSNIDLENRELLMRTTSLSNKRTGNIYVGSYLVARNSPRLIGTNEN